MLSIEPPPLQSASGHTAAPAFDEDTEDFSEDQVEEIFDSMERDWKGSLQAERQLQSLQKQLLDLQTQLGTMNRNLGPDERLYSDRLDQDDWPEA